MRTLFLNLASHDGLVACVSDTAVVASCSIGHRVDDREFTEQIEKVLDNAGWTYKDLTHTACVVGPGGFTSLRVGVAAANALSYALGIPSCGIHLSDLFKARAPSDDVLWLHSTKKHELFTRGFGRYTKDVPQAVCVRLAEFTNKVQAGNMWMGELIPEHRTVLDERGLSDAPLRPLGDVLPVFLAGQEYAKRTLQPWYGRGW